jgi:hypothetical protein
MRLGYPRTTGPAYPGSTSHAPERPPMISQCTDDDANEDAQGVLRLLAIIRAVTAKHDDPVADTMVNRFIADWCRHWHLSPALANEHFPPTRH